MNEVVYEERHIYTHFDDIDKAEEKNANFEIEARAVFEQTVKQYDMLYEAILELAKRHKASPCFKASQMYKKWFEPATSIAKEDNYPTTNNNPPLDGYNAARSYRNKE